MPMPQGQQLGVPNSQVNAGSFVASGGGEKNMGVVSS